MKKIIMLISVLAVMMVALSGCVDNTDDPEAVELSGVEGFVVVNEAPEGFEYLGSPSVSVDDVKKEYADVPGIVDAAEGIYQNSDFIELHIVVVEMEDAESAQNLISEYKSGIKQRSPGTTFTDESFNGHVATRIKDHIKDNGGQVERYEYIWNNDSFVFVVDGNSDDYTIIRSLAEATGN